MQYGKMQLHTLHGIVNLQLFALMLAINVKNSIKCCTQKFSNGGVEILNRDVVGGSDGLRGGSSFIFENTGGVQLFFSKVVGGSKFYFQEF